MNKNLRIGMVVAKVVVASVLLLIGLGAVVNAESVDRTAITQKGLIADTIHPDRAMVATVGRSVRGCFYGLVAVCVMLIPVPSEPSRIEPAGKV